VQERKKRRNGRREEGKEQRDEGDGESRDGRAGY